MGFRQYGGSKCRTSPYNLSKCGLGMYCELIYAAEVPATPSELRERSFFRKTPRFFRGLVVRGVPRRTRAYHQKCRKIIKIVLGVCALSGRYCGATTWFWGVFWWFLKLHFRSMKFLSPKNRKFLEKCEKKSENLRKKLKNLKNPKKSQKTSKNQKCW